jgi:ATP-dependent Lhr-like helicase
VRRGELDRIRVPKKPLDVLSQQIVGEVACREWGVDELFDAFRTAQPYADLTAEEFEQVLQMLAEGYSTRRGRRSAYLHYDTVNRRLRPRKGARLTAVTNAGVIPDQFDYDVVLNPEGYRIGSIGEDFAFESMPGDIFQLGNTSYRRAEGRVNKVFVEDARGMAPTLPFWMGEAPARQRRTLRGRLALARGRARPACGWRAGRAREVAAGRAATRRGRVAAARPVPRRRPRGARHTPDARHHRVRALLRRRRATPTSSSTRPTARASTALGLALRKRFCRQFNFELQASHSRTASSSRSGRRTASRSRTARTS